MKVHNQAIHAVYCDRNHRKRELWMNFQPKLPLRGTRERTRVLTKQINSRYFLSIYVYVCARALCQILCVFQGEAVGMERHLRYRTLQCTWRHDTFSREVPVQAVWDQCQISLQDLHGWRSQKGWGQPGEIRKRGQKLLQVGSANMSVNESEHYWCWRYMADQEIALFSRIPILVGGGRSLLISEY